MGVVVPIRRRAAGLGAVAAFKVDPLAADAKPEAVAVYQYRADDAKKRAELCTSHRNTLALVAGVGVSLGLTAVFSAKSSAIRLLGSGLAGAGLTAGAGAVYSHMRATDAEAEKKALEAELAKVKKAGG